MHRTQNCYSPLALGILLTFFSTFGSLAADPYAKAVVYSNILNGNAGNSQTDPSRALGAPDNLEVSLGGPGASIILDMGETTPVIDGPGADLEVREIGAAFGGVDESYRVLVSNSVDTNTFIYAGTGRALSIIDISSAGLASARYVWLQDLATETLSSATPGSDIDSVRVLFYAGNESDLQPPEGVKVRMTGQGVWLSWLPSTNINVTGYAIRRSLDGVSFGSSPDADLTSQETAWHDVGTLPAIGGYYYAVSSVAGSQESPLFVVAIPGEEVALETNSVLRVGDDVVAGWEQPSGEKTVAIAFALAGFAQGPQAELTMEAWDVDNSGNAILLNGAKVASVPTQSAESWAARSVRFPAGALQPGTNILVLSARNSSGGVTGSLDDFQVRNLRLKTFGSEAGVISGARFTFISGGQTNVTLQWVVEQTPSLAPPVWETVSSPISWTGSVSFSNGFYRLRDLE